jgi:hypothetical protein
MLEQFKSRAVRPPGTQVPAGEGQWPGAAAAIAVALGLWTSVAAAAARHLDLSPTVRAAEKRLGAAADPAVAVMISVTTIFYAAVQSSVPLLLLGLNWFALQVPRAYGMVRRARR